MSSTGAFPEPAARALVLRDVEMRFGAVRALRDVTFAVRRGSLCGLVGPNGAGKTTTMRILATDLVATDGEVEILGHALPGEAGRVRTRMGYMPDSAGLYEELTLTEYLEFFAAFHGMTPGSRARAVEVAIELAAARHLARRRLAGLSKGERQRVLLARSLLHDPELLILDEPADGLDPRGRVELKELLLLLHERGKTILISSHILADLEEICTDLVLIDRGRVAFSGSRERLFAGGLRRCRIGIEAMGPRERLRAVLAATEGTEILEEEDGQVVVETPPEPAFAAELLERLVAAGVRVVSFTRTTDSLEDIYLRLTEKAEGDL